MKTPSMCRIVVFYQAKHEVPFNGSREHPAIVNHVWAAMGGPGGINCTVFPDCGTTFSRTSVPHRSVAGVGDMCWDWPKQLDD